MTTDVKNRMIKDPKDLLKPVCRVYFRPKGNPKRKRQLHHDSQTQFNPKCCFKCSSCLHLFLEKGSYFLVVLEDVQADNSREFHQAKDSENLQKSRMLDARIEQSGFHDDVEDRDDVRPVQETLEKVFDGLSKGILGVNVRSYFDNVKGIGTRHQIVPKMVQKSPIDEEWLTKNTKSDGFLARLSQSLGGKSPGKPAIS